MARRRLRGHAPLSPGIAPALLLGLLAPAAAAGGGGEVHPCREVVVFFEDPASEALAREMGEFTCGTTRELANTLGLRHSQWARLLVPRDLESWRALAGASAGWASALFTTARRGMVILRPGAEPGPELERTLTHELVHMLVDRVTAGRLPRWLDEGLAQYLSGDRAEGAPGLPENGEQLVALELRWRRADLDPAERHLDYLRSLALTQRLIAAVGRDEVLGQLKAFRHLERFLEWDLKGRYLRQWLFEDRAAPAPDAADGDGVTELPLDELLRRARQGK